MVAATYGNSFKGSGSPRFEVGILLLTKQLDFLCFGTCREARCRESLDHVIGVPCADSLTLSSVVGW